MSHPSPALIALALALAACGPRYRPDTYATRAVQQANKVEQGTVVGRRPVRVSAEGVAGAATGAAAGGVVGAQTPGGGIVSALGGVGGALVGGLVGTAAEHTVVDTRAYEYVVRTTKGEMLSVTQSDTTPLAIGQNVLLIAGNQARIVPDYTFELATRPDPPAAAAATPPTSPAAAPAPTAEAAPVAPAAASPASVAATALAPAETPVSAPADLAPPAASESAPAR